MWNAWNVFWSMISRLLNTTDHLVAAAEKQAIRLDEFSERELLEARKHHQYDLALLDKELAIPVTTTKPKAA